MDTESRPIHSYIIRESLYLNVTRACTAHCVFCPRKDNPTVMNYDLKLEHDPTAEELIQAVDDPKKYSEIVFCGFGEPTLRLSTLTHTGHALKHRGAYLRLNTNGHGNIIHKRNIAGELSSYLDEMSVSLNASNAIDYNRVMNPLWGKDTFYKVLEFIDECHEFIPKITITAVAYPGFNSRNFRQIVSRRFNLPVRIRTYNRLGGPD